MIQIKKSLHVALLVADLDQAEWFYGQVLGLPKAARSLGFPGTWYQVGDFQIHLILAADPAIAVPNAEKLGRNRHLALAVEDIGTAQEQLSTHQVAYQNSASGRSALFTQDPDGNVIELTQVTEPAQIDIVQEA